MENDTPFIEAAIAILKLGASVAPLNPRYTSREFAATATDGRFRIIITDEHYRDILGAVITVCPVILYSELSKRYVDRDSTLPPVSFNDIAIVGYTSGTTGKPKGVVLSHANIAAAGFQRIPCEGQSVGTRVLLPTALGYTGGFVVTFLELTLLSGATLVLLPSFDVDECLDAIERYRINYLNVASPITELMAKSSRFNRTALSSLRSVCIGGTSVSLETLQLWNGRGVPLSQSYGQTETAGGVTFLPPHAAVEKIRSSGIAHMFTEVRISDDGKQGDVGEILVRGPSVMRGYLGNDRETATALADGWLHTGDLGSLDSDGFLTVVGRLNQMIISGGLNVYPAEIEAVMGRVDGVEEVVAIGVPDERWGEVPMLIVSCVSHEAVRRIDIVGVANSDLADYKRPKYLLRTTAPLPRNSAGKIATAELRARYSSIPHDAELLK
jgi:fatty-acyl-CoA synthase